MHLGALFLARFYPRPSQQPVYFSNPTWANHNQIFSNVGLPIKTYPYFSASTKGLDFAGMISQIEEAPEGSIVLLHDAIYRSNQTVPQYNREPMLTALTWTLERLRGRFRFVTIPELLSHGRPWRPKYNLPDGESLQAS